MADGTLKVGTITTSSGSGTITLGQSGETITVPSGVTMSGMGKVLQVVQGTFSTQTESTASNFVATGLTADITPQSTSNKILISYSLPLRNGASTNINIVSSIFKNGSNLLGSFGTGILKTDSVPVMGITGTSYLDSPSTTSSTTYAVYVNPTSVTAQWCGGAATATITLMEIAG
jgi:hypothetical protein